MIGAFGTLLFFAVTPVFANRAAGQLGSSRANFWRLVVAAALLGGWTYLCAAGVRPASFGWFVAGGMVGFGIGGLAMFHALPRIGSNLSNLIVQCGSAVAAGAVEWIWLGTRLTPTQLAFAAITIIGIALGLAPTAVAAEPSSARRKLTPIIKTGVILATISALAQGVGAVMSRKAFALAAKAYEPIDAGTAAFERVLGGLAIAAIALVISAVRRDAPLSAKSKAAVWVIANALTGPVLGVTCYQWALRTTPAGVVQPIVAAAPLLTIPFAAYFERSRPRLAYYVGACLAAAGVAGLALAR